jgi:diguanylate cyclase (GGDEF)-like protein/PAS domain S-box-containing protein
VSRSDRDWNRVRAGLREFRRPIVDIGEDDFVDALFLQRYVAIALLAVGSAFLAEFPVWVPLLVIVVGFGVNGLAHLQAHRTRNAPFWMHLTDMAAVVVFPAVAPRTLLPALLVMLAVVSLAATVSGFVVAAATTLLGTAGLLTIDLVRPLPQAALVVFSFALTALMIALTVGQLATIESEVRRRLNGVVDEVDAVLWIRDPGDGRFTFVNQPGTALFGWKTDRWHEPRFWSDHVHPDDVERAQAVLDEAIASGRSTELTYRFRSADGEWRHVQDRVSVQRDAAGQITAAQGISVDITERVSIERQVSQYADIVERIDQPIIVLRAEPADGQPTELILQAANPAAEYLVGRDLTVMIGSTLEATFPALSGSLLRERLVDVSRHGTPLRVDDVIIRPEGGSQRVAILRAFPLPDHSLAVSLDDVTEAMAASEALRRQALYDALTGLPNRRLFDQELHRALREAPSVGEQVALLVMDLDQFKEVNDALGHHVGDRLLCSVGDRLTGAFDHSLVARLGGDEFALVLRGHHDEASARAAAQQVRDVLSEPFHLDALRIQSNASIGIALFPEHADDVSSLVQRADVAMYQAKRSASGMATYAAEHDRSSVERLTLIGDLPEAVELSQFELYFQPCTDLRTQRAVRAEALIRWNHPRLGRIGPDEFIELAELSGAIQPITRWVVREGLAAATVWRAAGHDVGLALNLSARNLYDPELVDMVAEALVASGLPPHDLVLELTETGLMDDPSLAREVFTALGDLGVGTSVDDFGTGYSSLTFLRDLPLQEIKIDRSFVGEMHRRSEEFTIVRSMIDLGHNLGLEVVAEGVEHADDLVLLHRLGCDLAQGYHLSRPLPLAELLIWLDAHNPPQLASPELGVAAPSM